MNKIANSITLRASIAAALCLSIVVYPQLSLSSVRAALVPAANVKSESQLRTEASRYDGAIRAIDGIANMKFDTPEDVKKAVVILDRERPNLRFLRSKFVVMGLSDSAFISAVRKKLPNQDAAEAFAKQLTADTKLALTVEGAEALKTRIRRSIDSDVATLRRAASRLKEAAAKFKKEQAKSGQGTTPEFRVLKASFTDAPRSIALPETPAMPAVEPLSIVIIVVGVIGFVCATYLALRWYGPSVGIGTEEDKDNVADCQEATDGRYSRCVSEASDLPSGLPFFIREVAQAGCYSDWLARQAGCLALIV